MNSVKTSTSGTFPAQVDLDEASAEDGQEEFKSLTKEEAQALRSRLPQLSPWRVVVAQAAAGLVMTVLCWLVITGRGAVWSALYGAATVVVPRA